MSDLYDVAILGAGPAGATAALALRDSGLRVALVDKSAFPRDKVCGDAIPARCEKVLRTLDPRFAEQLRAFPEKVEIAECRVVAPNLRHFDYAFHIRGYCATRMAFDHFLLDLALQEAQPDFFPGFKATSLHREGSEWRLESRDQNLVARLVIGCDGANGITARQLTALKKIPKHHCAAVRGYYTGIGGLVEDRMEIHFLDDYLPGYFWVFPVGNGIANVGFGMLSDRVAARKANLRALLPEMVAAASGLKGRFAGAKLQGPVTGFGLPMGSRRVPMSGDGFLLCGDAASLIEPATGEGIGNAMLSARIAAETALSAFESGNLGAAALRSHDREVYRKLWKDLQNKYRAQRIIGERKWLMNWLVARANGRGPIRWLMQKVF
ncbi:MAG: geranylgeranyl reductase family protein [Bacteroidota bacterium]